jgi:hypothetical protein
MLRGKILIRLISNLAARSMGKGGLFFSKKKPCRHPLCGESFFERGWWPAPGCQEGWRQGIENIFKIGYSLNFM